MVLVEHRSDMVGSGLRRQSGTGGKCFERIPWHVGDEQGVLRRICGCVGKTATFDGGEGLANGIDGCDGRTAANKRLVEGSDVGKRDGGVQRKLAQRRAAARDEEENQCGVVGAVEQIERRTRGREGVGVGQWMTGGKVSNAGVGLERQCGCCADTAKIDVVRQDAQQCVEHGHGGFAEGDDEDTGK